MIFLLILKLRCFRSKNTVVDAMFNSETQNTSNTTWVLSTKCVGDKVAGWVIDSLEEDTYRYLESSERCTVTSFCYPTGAKVVRATLHKAS